MGANDGNIYYLKNTGTASVPAFAASQTNPFNLTDIGAESVPTFADIDNDGDLDAFVGANDGNINYFENTGTASVPTFAASQTNPFNLTDVGGYSHPTFADLDDDGDLDAFVGASDGNINYFENQPVTPNTPPTITSSNTASVAENNTDAITVQATDPDGDNITYSISGGEDESLFSIDADTGVVTFIAAPDFESPVDNDGGNDYQIEVTANDGTADSTLQAITITVTDVDETPTLEGTPGSDRFRGTNTAENYSALDGHDRVYGNGGADTLDGGDGNDIVYGGNDDDTLDGGVGHDRLNGDNGNDLLLGNDGNDILNGGAGDDTLNGGAGSDRYVGGAGADTFIIGPGLGVDLIQRFEDGTDIIELEGIGFAELDIVKSGSSTLIKVAATGEALASLSGIDVGLVGVDDFSQITI